VLMVRNLRAGKEGRGILKGVDLNVRDGEVLVIFGPNGAGKSTLLSCIMGVGGFNVEGGIFYNGQRIDHLPAYERARMGIALMYQFPPEVEGVRVSDLVNILKEKFGGDSTIPGERFYERQLFVGMSGGEKKILEAYITALMRPKLVMLDEPDSGVDIENVGLLAHQINEWIKKGVTVMIVTHTGAILNYISRADRAVALVDGKIRCEGSVKDVYRKIFEGGYSGLQTC